MTEPSPWVALNVALRRLGVRDLFGVTVTVPSEDWERIRAANGDALFASERTWETLPSDSFRLGDIVLKKGDA